MKMPQVAQIAPDDALRGLGQRLLAVRKTVARTSQADFAARLGYPKRTYVGWELGEREPSVFLPLALMREFQIDPAWVLAGPEEAPRSLTGAMGRQIREVDALIARLRDEPAIMSFQELEASRLAVLAVMTRLVETMHKSALLVAEAAGALKDSSIDQPDID